MRKAVPLPDDPLPLSCSISLEDVIQRHPRFVIATGGSLVSEPATFERLLSGCFTVYSKADIQVDTAGRTFEESLEGLMQALRDSPA